MHELGPAPKLPEITEDNLTQAQAAVRYQQIQRYEQMWQRVQERIQDDTNGNQPLDPRFLELGIRILKEEATIYRLTKPAPPAEEEQDPVAEATNRRDLVEQQLAELEAKRNQQQL